MRRKKDSTSDLRATLLREHKNAEAGQDVAGVDGSRTHHG
jgi:hypothetical protein